MIIFDLICSAGHAFEGWFRSAGDFESQLEKAVLACPHCASTEVRRLPSVVHVAARQSAAPSNDRHHPASIPMAPAGRAVLKMLADSLVAGSEDVGYRFAEEARCIHYQESRARPIRGKASEAECAELAEEGIEFFRLPDLQPKDFN